MHLSAEKNNWVKLIHVFIEHFAVANVGSIALFVTQVGGFIQYLKGINEIETIRCQKRVKELKLLERKT